MKWKLSIYAFILAIFFISLNTVQLYARAGGAGDFGTGNSDDGFFLNIIFFVLSFAPYPYNLWIIGAICLIALILWIGKKARK